MGFLADGQVIETSATDLIGEYVGQTGPKTQKLCEKALGRVLFIDEAYRLAEGCFAKEAMDEIVDCLTKPSFSQKLVVILAGYDADINRLMSINPGLTSRFPETVTFRSLKPTECWQLFTTNLKNKKQLDISLLEKPPAGLQQEILQHFEKLANLANWANARDVGTLAKAVFGQHLQNANPKSRDLIPLEEGPVIAAFERMINERSNREKLSATKLPVHARFPEQIADPRIGNAPPPSAPRSTVTTGSTHKEPPGLHPEQQGPRSESDDPRDPGVDDNIWAGLQRDKEAVAAREEAYHDLVTQYDKLQAKHVRVRQDDEEEIANQSKKQENRIEELRKRQADAEGEEAARLASEADEERRRAERERLRRELERRKRAEELAALERERNRLAEEKRKEQAVQSKLRTMGVCPMGYRWIKQNNGYRCAAGSHWVSNAALGIE